MKTIFSYFVYIFTFCFFGHAIGQDVGISGGYTPSSVAVGGTSTLQVLFQNNEFTSIDPGEVFVQITIPAANFMVVGAVGGTFSSYFNFTQVSANVWYGENTASLPGLLGPNGGEVTFDFTISGVAPIAPNNATIMQTDFINETDIEDQDNLANAGLEVTTVLPVEFISFKGKADECHTTFLDWVTANEVNNSGFEVQRSVGGREFEVIGFVKADLSGKNTHSYTFTDTNIDAYNGVELIYRLRQIDLDGGFDFSPLVEVRPSCDKERVSSLSPNPAFDKIKLDLQGMQSKELLIQVFSNTGQVIMNGNYENKANIELNIHELDAGIYTLRLVDGNYATTHSFIKVK